MARLIEARPAQLEPGRVDADAVAELHEGAELVDREDVLHAIGEMLGDVAGVVAERLRVSRDSQPPTRSWSACGKSQ